MTQRNEVAVLLAAGKGTRLFPLTEDTPKPLIQVQGKPLIETLIDAFRYRGVKKIYVIIGFKGEQFRYLEDKYDNLQLIENTQYQTTNNSSSVMALINTVEEVNSDYFICDADAYINNKKIFLKDFTCSTCWCKYTEGSFDEWNWVIKNNYAVDFNKGGKDGYTVCNIIHLKQHDAETLFQFLKNQLKKPENNKLFWEEHLNMCLDKIHMELYLIANNDIIEIDTVKDFDDLNRYLETQK